MREIQSHSVPTSTLCVCVTCCKVADHFQADVIHNTIHCQISNLLHSRLDSIESIVRVRYCARLDGALLATMPK